MIDDPEQGGSPAGSWKAVLPYCQNIRITEHPGDTHPLPAPGNCAATPDNPGVAPSFCDEQSIHFGGNNRG